MEAVAQKPYGSYVDEMIFRTANMDNTYLYDRQQVQPLTRAYERDGEKFIDVSFANPSCKFGAGGFVSTATDLTKFSKAFFDGKLISPEMIKLAIEGDVSNSIFITGGVSAGSRAILGINVKTGDSVVILGNQRGTSFDKTLEEVFKLLK